jgi:hypothetical protein
MSTVLGKGSLLGVTLAALLALSSTAQAAERCVSTVDQLTVALYDAETNQEDDAIKIVKGTYVGNFSYKGEANRALTLNGGYAPGCSSQTVRPGQTILDGGHLDKVLYILNTAGGKISISNLTARNGEDGGVYIADNAADVEFKHVWMIHNDGPGIEVYGGKTVSVTSSYFARNAYGGVLADGCQSFVSSRSTYKDNFRRGAGAGVHANNMGYVELKANTFSGNKASNSYPICGGGAYLGDNGSEGSRIIVSGNTFTSNSVGEGMGAAICIGRNTETIGASVRVNNNKMISNHNGALHISGATASFWYFDNIWIASNTIQENDGSAPSIFTDAKDVNIINNMVTNNTIDVPNSGNAIVTVRAHTLAAIINNTITGNVRTNEGDGGGGLGVYLLAGSTTPSNNTKASIYNNIIWSNTATLAADIFIENDVDRDLVRSPVKLFKNDFNQTRPSGFKTKLYIPIDASNMNNVDPLFTAPADFDFHLQASSPVIDKGNSAAPRLPKTDFEGDKRVIGANVDLGADELEP